MQSIIVLSINVRELQPEEVLTEKKRIYDPCIPDLKQKYKLKDLTVYGVLVGTRRTISISAIKGSHQIINNHLYSIT